MKQTTARTQRHPAPLAALRPSAVMRAVALAIGSLALTAHATPGTANASYPTWDGKQETVRYATPDDGAALRSYTQSTTMRVREGGKQEISYTESAALPTVRSGNLAFDALFALAGAEMKLDSVSEIRDGSYNGGNAIPCECFETGELWHYVWTRDLSYAASLGLGMLDPQRTRNSLEFKMAGYRDGVQGGLHAVNNDNGYQIVQDTGSGGSWPVSTDRVTWAFGADEALKALPPAERKVFAEKALRALRNTLENDRIAIWDAADGLYNGEESFLDWRDQTYAAWMPNELSFMATSKALSTNAAHYKALTLAAQLAAEQGDRAAAARYGGWATALKAAINKRFWQADSGMYSSVTAGHFDGAAMYKYDWLGQSLAIVTGIADQRQAQSILAHYPHGPLGAPVIWPQQSDTAVYHNRAMWPFVTAYGLKAAALGGNVAVADAAYDTLMRGAATNLSNMENLEWLSGQPMLDDGKLSGPVVNSRRQLWSVGGYLGMVVGSVFGVQTTNEGIALRPFITAKLRREAFAGSDAITLNNLALRGKRISVRIALPAAAKGNGYYTVDRITLNGKPAGASLAWEALGEDNVVEIRLGKLAAGQQTKRSVSGKPLVQDAAVYAPAEPRITQLERGSYGLPTLHIASGNAGATPDATAGAAAAGTGGIVYNIYRNGQLVGARISAATWADRNAVAADNLCYAVEAVYVRSGNRSHHSMPVCLNNGQEIAVERPAWGAPADTFAQELKIDREGSYAIQIKYRNTAHQINLGVSGGVKWAALKDSSGNTVANAVVQLPHSPAEEGAKYSTPLRANLKPGSYTLQLDDFYNMSYMKNNATYSDAGGVKGPSNKFDIQGVRIMPVPKSEAANKAIGTGTLRIVDNFASPQLGNSRKLRIYLPPGYDANPQQRYPVLYLHDGQNLFDPKTAAFGAAWEIGTTVDKLIATGAIEPIIVVGIDNAGEQRINEYTPCCDKQYGGGKIDAYAAFIVDTVKPWADTQLRTLKDREHTAIMGSSLGGIASVYIGQKYPQVFSKAAGVSSSFWWNEQMFIKQLPPRSPVKFYLDAGTNNDGIEDTRKMRDAMQAKGYDLYYHEAEGGIHNEKSWAARVDIPLTWFFRK
ncbi:MULTISPECIES: alpha/beta hydrolase-fold protein [unclassified Duganella]|uniref:alpha/beta hydrolase-fold protein n=1 Tax=unclassified Duganella TaxID=2636909 RepID=UPI00088962C6|nr:MULTISPECIES: alpha/beta hydrolase-fold protein [unclassified Duganella]SDF96760.1 Predicted hydrolase of the alpha/beta superfamily [Duganella sp. OV458]SDJ08017.1 Predicted hydrolase of the alpha/beta superfamily [Duganella sp. OV510]